MDALWVGGGVYVGGVGEQMRLSRMLVEWSLEANRSEEAGQGRCARAHARARAHTHTHTHTPGRAVEGELGGRGRGGGGVMVDSREGGGGR